MIPKILLITGEKTKYTEYFLNKLLIDSSISLTEVSMSNYISQEANITVTFGQEVLSLVSDESLSDVRGTVLKDRNGRKILPTISLDDLSADLSLEIIVRADLIKARKEKDFPEVKLPNWDLKIYPTFLECVTYLESLQNVSPEKYIAFDLETDLKNQQILCLGLAHSEVSGISIPFTRKDGSSYWNVEEETILWKKIGEFFVSSVKKVAHNACFDVASLWQNNRIWVNNLYFDTMLAWHVLYLPGSSTGFGMKKDLGFISSMILNIPAWKHKSKEDLATYNVKDCCATWALVKPLEQDIKNKGLTEIFNLEMSEIEPACYLSLRGIKIDTTQKKKIEVSLDNLYKETEERLNTLLVSDYGITETINFRSPKQLKDLLYITMRLPVQTVRGTDQVTTNEKALEKLYRKTKNEVLSLILKHREISKLKSFCDIKISPTGRVHTSYNIAGTSSGRWSSSENIILPYGSGNLQQIPSRGEGNIIRSMYVVNNPENWIIQADFVQAEAIVIAYLIGDNSLKEAFRLKKDIHKVTASMMFDISTEEITSEQREIGKMIRHATNYSLGAQGLAEVLCCDVSTAKKYLVAFHESCPQLKRWQETIQTQLQSTRTLVTPLVRKKVFYGRFDDTMFRSGYSYIPQSTIGDLLNKSLVKFYNWYGEEYSLLLQLHDAMYVDDVPEDKIQDCVIKMKSCMTWEILINGELCTVDVDFKQGKNWQDMKKIPMFTGDSITYKMSYMEKLK